MASMVEQLTQVHVYLDSVHDASIKAIKFSQDRAVDLAKGFIEVQKEAPAEHRLTPPSSLSSSYVHGVLPWHKTKAS